MRLSIERELIKGKTFNYKYLQEKISKEND